MEKDENGDGKSDGLQIEVELETNETIHFVQLFLLFSYQLQVGLNDS